MIALLSIFLTIAILALTGASGFRWSLFLIPAMTAAAAAWVRRSDTASLHNPVLLFGILFVFFALLSVLPVPPPFDTFPQTRRNIQNRTAEAAFETAEELNLAHNKLALFSLSRNRSGSARMLLLILAAMAIGSSASSLPQRRRRQTLLFLAGTGFLIAALGYASQHPFPQEKTIWWLFNIPHGRPVGCFLNRNHFGGFLAMLLPVPAMLFAREVSLRRRKSLLAVFLIFIATMSFALIMSLSRGAWIAGSASMIITFGYLWIKRGRSAVIPIVLMSLLIAITLRLSATESARQRFEEFRQDTTKPQITLRFQTWRDSLRVMAAYPLLGTGLNAFEMVIPRHRSTTTRKSISHAENEYLQLPCELGAAGILVFGLLVAGIYRWASINSRKIPDEADFPWHRAIMLGSTAALLSHSFFDFVIRSPLYLLTYVAVICCCAGPGISPIRQNQSSHRTIKLISIWTGALFVIAATCFFNRQISCHDSSDWLETASSSDLCEALEWAPTSWQIWYHLGRNAIMAGDKESRTFGEQCISQALHYDPANYRVWKELCLVRLSLGDRHGARQAFRELRQLRSWVRVPGMTDVNENKTK